MNGGQILYPANGGRGITIANCYIGGGASFTRLADVWRGWRIPHGMHVTVRRRTDGRVRVSATFDRTPPTTESETNA